jgi:hypothetical protein
MYFRREDTGARLSHGDQFRGVEYCYAEPAVCVEPNPDFFQYVDLGGPGLTPVGYGYRSIEAIVDAAIAVERGERTLAEIDAAGILATPANSSYNDRVVEAGRESVQNGGRVVRCEGG